MRMQFLLLLVVIIAASVQARPPGPPRPPAPTSFVCNATTASALGVSITNAVNSALLPKANNANTTSTSKSLWSFGVPANKCVGDYFPMIDAFEACTKGGETGGMSTTKTKTVTGAYNLKINVTLSQTSCSVQSNTATGTFSVTATFPGVTYDEKLGVIFALLQTTRSVELEATLSDLTVEFSGSYGYNVTATTGQLCVTDLDATETSVSVSDVTVKYGVPSDLSTATNLDKRVEDALNGGKAANKVETKLNKAFAQIVGKCKTVGTPNPPRAPRPPKSPNPPRPPASPRPPSPPPRSPRPNA